MYARILLTLSVHDGHNDTWCQEFEPSLTMSTAQAGAVAEAQAGAVAEAQAENVGRQVDARPIAGITPPGHLKVRDNLAQNWKEWKQLWQAYEVVARLDREPDAYRIATFITCLGAEALKIFNGLTYEASGDEKKMNKVLEQMDKHCIGEINVTYERFCFNRRNQGEHESVDKYITALTELVRGCNFGPMESDLLKDRLVCGVRDNTLRKQLLQKRGLKLDMCIDMCRASENTMRQLHVMEGENQVHQMQPPIRRSKSTKKYPAKQTGDKTESECGNCGLQHGPKRESCPAYGRTCSNCGKANHYARKCRQRKGKLSKQRIRSLQEVESTSEETESDEQLLTMILMPESESTPTEAIHTLTHQSYKKQLFATMQVGVRQIRFQLDTGATCNVVRQTELPPGILIEPTKQTLSMFSKDTLKPVGKCQLRFHNPKTKKRYVGEFIVVRDAPTLILGAKSVQQMGLIKVKTDRIHAVTPEKSSQATVNTQSRLEDEHIFEQYKDVFQGDLGCFQGLVHLDVDLTVKKSQLPIQRVPVAMKQPLKDELDRLATMGTIERVDHPTDWMSHLVTVRKPNGSLRLCLDPQPLNRALKRCHFPIPTLDDVLPEITQARVYMYSVADVRNGFWHCELDEESKDLTTFGTPFGRYRWARMPFGISPAPEIFQIKLQAAISGLPGVYPIADDILIVGEGATDGEAEEDHDRKLRQFLDRCREKSIKLNKEKFRLRLSDVSYMEHLLTKEGLHPDPQKIAAITKMPPPQDVAGVRRLLGLVNYLARFVPNLTDLCEPIRQLTHLRNEWQWSHVQDNAFTTLKEAITRVPVLQFFNTTKEVTVQCDASSTGLVAALLQEGQPVEFASRALTPTERPLCTNRGVASSHVCLREISSLHLRQVRDRGIRP